MTQRKRSAKASEPKADRPGMPKGYGVPKHRKGLMSWRSSARRLARAHNYWVVTASLEGRPHAVPIWGVWVEGALYFGTDRSSRKARNLARNPAVVAHLESGDDTLVLEGVAEELNDAERLAVVDEAYRKKYEMKLTEAPGDLVVFALRPRVALAWSERGFPKDATRWKFD